MGSVPFVFRGHDMGQLRLVGDVDLNEGRGARPVSVQGLRAAADRVLTFLNEKAGRNFRPVPVNIDFIVARMKEGYTEDELRQVVAMKCREWKGDEVMEKYLRPETLFNRSKFSQYVGFLDPA